MAVDLEGHLAPALSVRGLKVYFNREPTITDRIQRAPTQVLKAVDGIDLEVRSGEVLGLVGESGSGKSTLARCLVGLQKPSEGEMFMYGHELAERRTSAERRNIQMVFQDPYSSLNPRMTVRQVLRELLAVHELAPRRERDARAASLLSMVGMGPESLDSLPRQFSGGQRQRIGIARALALEPQILIADEPVSALDVSIQASILNLLRRLQADLGLTLLFVAHNLAVVRHLCDRVAVMYLGRIVEVAPTPELFSNPRHPYTQGLLRAIPRLAHSRTSGVAVKGDPPSPLMVPSGCRFHPRCPISDEICITSDPALIAGNERGDHAAACHFAWPVSS